MDPKVAAWFVCSAVIIGSVVSALRADNLALPFTLSTGMRASVALALGAAQTFLMDLVSNVALPAAIGTAVASVVTAFLAHGAPHVATDAPNTNNPATDGATHVEVIAVTATPVVAKEEESHA